jgi:hypothetical protein
MRRAVIAPIKANTYDKLPNSEVMEDFISFLKEGGETE